MGYYSSVIHKDFAFWLLALLLVIHLDSACAEIALKEKQRLFTVKLLVLLLLLLVEVLQEIMRLLMIANRS